MRFDLVRPCANCPFRSDKPFFMKRERVLEILGDRHGKRWWPATSFVCHKTIDYGGSYEIAADDASITCKHCGRTSYNPGDIENRYCGHCNVFHDDEPYIGPDAQQCAGVMAILHREGRPNDAMQIAQRFGLWDPSKLDPDAPFYESVEAAIKGQGL